MDGVREQACYILNMATIFVMDNELDYVKWKFIPGRDTIFISFGLEDKIVGRRIDLDISNEAKIMSIFEDIERDLIR